MAFDKLDASDLDTFIAGTDLSMKQHYFVVAEEKSGALKLAVAATAGGRVTGVLQDKPNADGVACLVAGSGVSKVLCGSAVTQGQFLMSSSAGEAVTAVAGAAHYVAKALETGTAGTKIAAIIGYLGPTA